MKNMFCDDATGQLSFVRLSAAVVILLNLIYAGWIVYKTTVLPDIPTGWLTYVLIGYGLHKASSTVSATVKGNSL